MHHLIAAAAGEFEAGGCQEHMVWEGRQGSGRLAGRGKGAMGLLELLPNEADCGKLWVLSHSGTSVCAGGGALCFVLTATRSIAAASAAELRLLQLQFQTCATNNLLVLTRSRVDETGREDHLLSESCPLSQSPLSSPPHPSPHITHLESTARISHYYTCCISPCALPFDGPQRRLCAPGHHDLRRDLPLTHAPTTHPQAYC